ncbi:MAG TPA: DUF2905 domain-containing protein [Polyangiales bacterium]|jgi:ribose/xylose/arabinose/galactoside ABC-type transport system permease subunit|nr:DUF2905 domain-containing protein [Polyangiales bacterium]
MPQQLARTLITLGLVFVAVGLALFFGEKLGLGRLPGDLLWKRKNTTVYFPIVTSVLLSVVLSLLFSFFVRRK